MPNKISHDPDLILYHLNTFSCICYFYFLLYTSNFFFLCSAFRFKDTPHYWVLQVPIFPNPTIFFSTCIIIDQFIKRKGSNLAHTIDGSQCAQKQTIVPVCVCVCFSFFPFFFGVKCVCFSFFFLGSNVCVFLSKDPKFTFTQKQLFVYLLFSQNGFWDLGPISLNVYPNRSSVIPLFFWQDNPPFNYLDLTLFLKKIQFLLILIIYLNKILEKV